jgi:hypothetical protein
VIVTDANTCTATDTVHVTIHTLPVVNLGADIVQCGGSATLNAGNAGAGFAWSNSATTQTVTISSTATLSVTVTDANTCTATDTASVTIHTIPTVTLALTRDTACQNSGAVTLGGGLPAGGSYFGTSVSSGSFTPAILGANSVSYTYTDGNGCKDTASAVFVVKNCSGISELSAGTIAMYPNPATDVITLRAEGISGAISITLTDALGKVISRISDETSSAVYTHTFNVNEFAKGTYLVNISTANGNARYKFIVQ